MDELTIRKIATFSTQLMSCTTFSQVQELLDLNEELDNPYIYQSSGQWCLTKNIPDNAIPLFKKAVQYGLKFPNAYWDSPLADSIGSSIAKLLTVYKTSSYGEPIQNLFILGYSYLSNSIDLLKENAFESSENRATLFIKSTNNLVHDIIPMGVFPQVYAISDLLKSSHGLSKNGYGAEAKEKHFWAYKLHTSLEDLSVAGKNADKYSLEEIARVGEQRHKHLYDSIKETLLANDFTLSLDELDEIIGSFSPKNT